MENYNIQENRPELTKQQIEKGMDFSKVKQRAASSGGSAFNNAIIAGIGVAVLLVSSAGFFSKQETQQISEHLKIVLASDENKVTTFMVDPARDTTLLYKTGTFIKIPAQTFADDRGNKIKGLVELTYREFHNVGEILLSGIPMTYDSAGTNYHFESAGMFEINASQNGHRVLMANGKSVEVNLISLNKKENRFNQYYFDETTGKWNFEQKDVPVTINNSDNEERPIAGLNLIKPVLKKKGKQQFTVNISYEDFPELRAFEHILFEVSDKTKNFDPASANTTWNDVTVDRIGNSNEYRFTFTYKEKSTELTAYPVVNEKDFKKARTNWDCIYNNYKMQSMVKTNEENKQQQKLKAEVAANSKIIAYFKELRRKNEALAITVCGTEEVVFRTFQIKNFGIWNSDCPSALPKPLMVNATYVTEDGKKVDVATVYLVEHGKNALYSLFNKGQVVYYNPKNEYSLIVVTMDNSIGVFAKSDFKFLNATTKDHVFKLKMTRKEKYSPADINALI